MAVRGRAIHKNHNPTLYIYRVISPYPFFLFFIMVAYPGHILESSKGIEIKPGTYIDVNERKCRRQESQSYLTFYLNYLSLFFL